MICRLPILSAAAGALLLAACATTPPPSPIAAAPPPITVAVEPLDLPPLATAPVLAPRERVRRAVEMLDKGDEDAARAEVALLLSEQPDHAVGRSLLDQIDKDPKALLGARNYPYKVRPGETLSILAGRFLGDPLLFYALARYNGIARPDTNEVGRTLLIPGTPRRAAAASTVAAKPPAGVAGPDPGRASGLRRTALEAMSSGGIDRAVALLQQAAPLDPANSLIQADLERALRIQANVRNR
jgi:hypothetical protein